MLTYNILTPYGNRYETDESGRVLAHSNGYRSSGSDSWMILGVRRIGPFNHLGPLIPLSQAVNLKDLHFKNGNPRYTIQDLDHGAVRVVGNWNYHGVRAIYAIEK
jgi:hypothetical protein